MGIANTEVGFERWQPPGCMMHHYKPDDFTSCLGGRRVIFAGDSNMRTTFYGMVALVDSTWHEPTKGKAMHQDAEIITNGVKLQFIWDPYINGSRLAEETKNFYYQRVNNDGELPAALMVVGGGLWHARFTPIEEWKADVDRIVGNASPGLNDGYKKTSDLFMFAPIPIPLWENLSDIRKATILPPFVNEANAYLQNVQDTRGIDVITSWNKLTEKYPLEAFRRDGLHAGRAANLMRADMLLNLRCNAELSQTYPFDKTCCTNYPSPNHLQWITLFLILMALPVVYSIRRGAFQKSYFKIFVMMLSLTFKEQASKE